MAHTEDQDSAFRAAQLATIIARAYPAAYPHHIACAVVALRRTAAAAKRHATNLCNSPLTEQQENRAENRIGHLVTRATELMNLCAEQRDPAAETPPSYKITTGGDPRGACAWLKIDGIEADGWDRETGFAIY